ncbi:MAG: MBOAT family protein [Gammaproteobacteria bacterium]|nr:MBOAT family protein [Gammaproteobacteria bacterium]
MLFNSYIYIFLFLPITFGLYFLLIRGRRIVSAKLALVLASLFFYSWWSVNYLPILLFSLVFNFLVGEVIQRELSTKRGKFALILGISVNLILLGYFKYADFFIENVNYVLGQDIGTINLVLPLAISFFTFQQIAYLVDCYKGEVKEYDFLNYSLFVCFFPQLIAGPIVHHGEMMPQFMRNRWNLRLKYSNIAAGLFIFSIGLFKKVVIADTFAVTATNGFDYAETLNMVEAWVTSLSYTLQLYFDFSGYTDMAIGAALLFNIKLPDNFNSPYKALDIQDFWRRWHMTLSRFLRDYIYIPLGGSRVSNLVTYRNIIATFLIGGLWHGAGWTFIMWGVLHGLAMVVHNLWLMGGYRLSKFIAWFITFNFINISWVFFRAKDFETVKKVLSSMFTGQFVLDYDWQGYRFLVDLRGVTYGPWLQNIYAENKVILYVAVCLVMVGIMKNSNELIRTASFSRKTAVFASLLFVISVLNMNKASEFLYFNF